VFGPEIVAQMLTQKVRNRITVGVAALVALGLGAWPVSIVLRKDVHLIDSQEELRPGLGARGAFGNSGSRGKEERGTV
jgi:hypothetical protein